MAEPVVMEIKPNSFTVVIVGRWNPYILAPQWITQHLFNDVPPVQIEFSLNLDLPNRYKILNVLITPTPEKVILTSVDNSVESLTQMGEVAIKLCNTLAHTPLNAIGINFGYIEKENRQELLENFDFEKNDPFSENEWEIKSHLIQRSLIKDNYKLNFSLSMDENDNFHFDFNYNYVLPTREFIQELLADGKIISFYENSLELMENFYELKLQNND